MIHLIGYILTKLLVLSVCLFIQLFICIFYVFIFLFLRLLQCLFARKCYRKKRGTQSISLSLSSFVSRRDVVCFIVVERRIKAAESSGT